MQREFLFFTAGQFAALHHLNKRTLHYYDDIGLFSPAHKGANGYRYYTYRQSADLENILSLRELGMSTEEIKDYLKHPNSESFLNIASQKLREIDEQMKRLRKLKELLLGKRLALVFCEGISDGTIEIVHLPRRLFLRTPVPFRESALTNMKQVMEHLQTAWECSDYKTGCGCYISLDKVRRGEFELYDGLFTSVKHPRKGVDLQILPEGQFLRGYSIGDWGKIPGLYQKMMDFAAEQDLELSGICYESGLNEFAISCEEEYVTQIEIPIRANSHGTAGNKGMDSQAEHCARPLSPRPQYDNLQA